MSSGVVTKDFRENGMFAASANSDFGYVTLCDTMEAMEAMEAMALHTKGPLLQVYYRQIWNTR